MNVNAAFESSTDTPDTASATISTTRLLYWSVRRELWENRSICVAPLAVAAVFLVGFTISVFRRADRIGALALNAVQQQKLIQEPYTLAALLLMGTTFIVADVRPAD